MLNEILPRNWCPVMCRCDYIKVYANQPGSFFKAGCAIPCHNNDQTRPVSEYKLFAAFFAFSNLLLDRVSYIASGDAFMKASYSDDVNKQYTIKINEVKQYKPLNMQKCH